MSERNDLVNIGCVYGQWAFGGESSVWEDSAVLVIAALNNIIKPGRYILKSNYSTVLAYRS